MVEESVIEKLKAVREKNHLSLQDVAVRIGVDRMTVHRWEKYQCQPQGENYRSLVDFITGWTREGE